MRTEWADIHNRRHTVSIAFPMNVAEATKVKLADGSANIGTPSKRFF
jgi:hypothetical protein